MKSRTITICVQADRDEVYPFLADSSQLRVWARGSCEVIEQTFERRTWDEAEERFAVLGDEATGVIDVFYGEFPDEMMVLPMRVLTLPHGCAVTATVFCFRGLGREHFEQRYSALLRDMRDLLQRFGRVEISAPEMDGSRGFHLGVVTDRFYETWDFYTTHFGFRTVLETDTYVQLTHPDGASLGIQMAEVDGQPASLICPSDGRGVWLGVESVDLERERVRLGAAGIELVDDAVEPRPGRSGFAVRDPNGMLVRVISHFDENAEPCEQRTAGRVFRS